jgi:LysM domain-containing protein
MRKTIITLVVAVASLVPAAAGADGMPPSASKQGPGSAAEGAPNASKVTMSDLQPDAPGEYTVQKGDTLWGIAGRFLKDPWKWPQVWNMNREQIKDPHWIYPGNVIRLDTSSGSPQLSLGGAPGSAAGDTGPSGGTEAQAVGNVVVLNPRTRVETLQAAVPSIPGSAIGPFLSQPLVVEQGGLDGAPTIIATEESRVIVGQGDVAYADRIGSNSGVNWQVFRTGETLHDPETGEVLGVEAKYVGDARVRRFGNPTTIEVTKARTEINRGDRLTPAREVTFPSYVPRAPDKPIKGVIMSVDGGVSELGQYQIITINRGARDGIEVGHVLASYHRGAYVSPSGVTQNTLDTGSWFSGWDWWNRMNMKPNPVVPDSPGTQASSGDTAAAGAKLEGSSIKLPDERNGLIFVFRVFEKMSYAMVMKATRPIYVGDLVQTP